MSLSSSISVCHLASGDLWGGAEAQILAIVEQLKKQPRINPTVVLLNKGILADRLIELGITVTIIDERANTFLSLCKQLRKKLKEQKVDIVHTHRYKENILGAIMKYSKAAHCIVQTIHGNPEPFVGFNNLKMNTYLWINKQVTKNCFDHTIAVSSNIKDQWRQCLNEDQISVIHNGIFIPNKQEFDSVSVRKELDLPQSCPIIAGIGRLVPVKGFDVFLEAAYLIIQAIPNVQFILIGDGPESDRLKQKAGDLKINANLKFLGFRSDINRLLSVCSAFILSSQNEGIPITLLEAMALGVPVICTKVGGIPEVVLSPKLGILVDPNNPAEMANAAIEMLKESELRSNMANNAYAYVKNNFALDAQVAKLINVYEKILVSR